MMRADGCDQDTRSDESAMGSRQQSVAMITAAVMLSGTLAAQELPGKAFAVSPPSAEDRAFWSFRPLKIGQPPDVGNAAWCRNAVDRFILSRLEQRGLAANDRADRRTLLRRAHFSLLGLPPRPGELVAFQDEHSPAAWSDVVDRLLASPRYGERWARHWMDVARFAESGGFEHDDDRPNAYHYRDFLVAAFNGDLPFDRFVRWQLAGDELAPGDPLALMATGFLGAGVFPSQLTEAEFESARYDELDDMVTTTGVAFLGLSIGCARCHDHKYDPIPSRDYYRLVSAFTTTIRGEIATRADWHQADHKVLVTSEGLPKLKHHADGRGFPHFYKQTFFLARGDVRQKQGEADVGFLQVLVSPQAAESRWQRAAPPGWTRTSFRRASLAGWLTDVEQGAGRLVARVIVNRLWHYHFGRGLVETTNDFGRQGERPSHPGLLDWLAGELIGGGWRLKPIHRLMLTSSVYCQDGRVDATRQQRDLENRLWWHRPRRRLEAEAIRDALLSVSDRLDPTMFGKGSLDEAVTRRSVYLTVKRSRLAPTMMLFDWPEHLVSIGRRAKTTTASQALAFMNSPVGRGYARALEARLPLEGEKAFGQAWRLALGRDPRADERTMITGFLRRQEQIYQRAGRTDAARTARVDLCQALLGMNEFIYID
ncbi:MAG: DUF1549 and DUF1553 domain-containing protein [Planctomycetaceae bacterium]